MYTIISQQQLAELPEKAEGFTKKEIIRFYEQFHFTLNFAYEKLSVNSDNSSLSPSSLFTKSKQHESDEDTLGRLKNYCISNKDSAHPELKTLVRELLNNWEVIFRILQHPSYLLTNNKAERALSHWVIFKKITLGTQSEVGRRTTCALAILIETNKRLGQCWKQVFKSSMEYFNGRACLNKFRINHVQLLVSS